MCFLQDWRAEAGQCGGGRPWLRWHLTSGDFVSSSCCRDAEGRGCELAGAQRWRQIQTGLLEIWNHWNWSHHIVKNSICVASPVSPANKHNPDLNWDWDSFRLRCYLLDTPCLFLPVHSFIHLSLPYKDIGQILWTNYLKYNIIYQILNAQQYIINVICHNVDVIMIDSCIHIF